MIKSNLGGRTKNSRTNPNFFKSNLYYLNIN